jgi:hypothetical protein
MEKPPFLSIELRSWPASPKKAARAVRKVSGALPY